MTMKNRKALCAALAAAALQSGCSGQTPDRGLDIRRLNVNGVSLSYVDAGAGDPVLAVHGAISDLRAWTALGERLSDDRRFIAYTQRYFGEAQWPDQGEAFSSETHANDLTALVEALDVGPMHLVTWSYGGGVATLAAIRRPDLFRTIVHYEPSLDALITNPERDAASRKAVAEAMAPAIAALNDGNAEQAAFRFAESISGRETGSAEREKPPLPAMFRDNARTLALMMQNGAAQGVTCEDLRAMKIPTLIVYGNNTHDRYKAIAEAMNGCLANAELRVLPEARHDGPYRHAQAFAALIKTFQQRN